MQYELNQLVRNTISGEQGVIKGRTEYTADYDKPNYWVVFKDAQGRASEAWWHQNEFEPLNDANAGKPGHADERHRARLVHIIGTHGIDKARLADSLVDRYKAQGLAAAKLSRLYTGPLGLGELKAFRTTKIMRRTPYTQTFTHVPCDVVVVCHHCEPLGLEVEPGDEVIRMEAGHA